VPIYHVGIAAVAASTDVKWIDNLLARFEIPGVDRSHQGIARRISPAGLRHIVLIRWLSRELGITLSTAVDLAGRALSAGNGIVGLAPGIELHVDLDQVSEEVEAILGDAVESLVPARRGRPPRSRALGDD
jgi:hypothetical protein